MNETKIPLSKTKLVIAFIGSVIFVVLGVTFVLNPENYNSFVFRSEEMIVVVGYASVIFLVFA